MFGTAKIYEAAGAIGGVLLVAFLLVYAGFRIGQQNVQIKWDTIEKERAESIVGLAQRYADADAEVTRLRSTKQAVVEKRVTEVRREIIKIPVRLECGHSDDEYRLLLDTFCVRNPTDPKCLH